MRNKFLEKRLPQSIGFLVLAVSLVTIGWLSRNAIIFGTKAATGNIPKNVKISNITSSTFAVSYTTDERVFGSISYGLDQNLNLVALDDRDNKSKQPAAHKVHHVTISDLNPTTKYVFSIVSGDEVFSSGDIAFEVTTAPNSDIKPTNQQLLDGVVTLDDGSFPTEGIVYVESSDSQLLSALVLPDGSYKIDLSTILKKNLSENLTLNPDTVLKMSVTNSEMKSDISLLNGQTNPVPQVIFSKNYDFTISDSPIAQSAVSSPSAEFSDIPAEGDSDIATSPQILSPENEQEFKDQQPLFKGKAIPGAEVVILIQSEHEIRTTVIADDDGNWQYRPEEKLDPGNHTITINTVDAVGILQTLTQPFTVFAQGSQFVEPSVATPTSSPTSAPTNTPAPTVARSSPTPIPTLTITPTGAPTLAQPTIIVISSPSAIISSPVTTITQPPIPPAGTSSLLFGFIGIGAIIGIGSLLFFLL